MLQNSDVIDVFLLLDHVRMYISFLMGLEAKEKPPKAKVKMEKPQFEDVSPRGGVRTTYLLGGVFSWGWKPHALFSAWRGLGSWEETSFSRTT